MEILKKFTDFAVNSGWCVDGESTQNGFLFYNAQTNDRWIGWQAAQIPVAPESFEQAYSEIFSPIVKRPYPRLENGDYKYIEIDQGWKLWQAATAQAAPEEFVVLKISDVREILSNASDAICDEKASTVFSETGSPSTWYDHHLVAEKNILDAIEAQEQNHV